jgi:hypothetical protein
MTDEERTCELASRLCAVIDEDEELTLGNALDALALVISKLHAGIDETSEADLMQNIQLLHKLALFSFRHQRDGEQRRHDN